MKNIKYNGIWIMALMFIIFVTVSILHWHTYSNASEPPKSWIPQRSWSGNLSSILFIVCGGWFAIRAYYKGARVFWILQVILAVVSIIYRSGVMNEHAHMILNFRYTAQSLLWGGALLLCATHGASIFVIKKKQAEPVN